MKKLLLTLFAFSLLFSSAFAQNEWSPRASLPDSARCLGIGFSIGNYGYVGLGGDMRHPIQYFRDFWRFDPRNNSWTRMMDFPGRARILPATFVIGNYAYVVTGSEVNFGYALLTECWQYNAVTNQWTQKANFPGISRYADVGFAIGGKGFVGTGYDTINSSRLLRDMWEYDTTTNTWTQKNDFGGDVRYVASAFSVGSKGYVCFGLDSIAGNFQSINDMWEYDIGSDSWTQKSSSPFDSIGFASGFIIGSDIYIGTGQNYYTAKITNDFWRYNTLTDTWTEQTRFPGASRGGGATFSVADTGYLGFGEDSASTPFNSIYRFIPDSTLGTESISIDDKIVLYPNPVKQKLNIELLNNTASFDVKIYGIMGNELISLHFNLPDKITPVNVSSLTPGVYLIKILSNEINYTSKFIKL